MAFSKLKAALRQGAKRTVKELWRLIGNPRCNDEYLTSINQSRTFESLFGGDPVATQLKKEATLGRVASKKISYISWLFGCGDRI
jgi:hypothetical protein